LGLRWLDYGFDDVGKFVYRWLRYRSLHFTICPHYSAYLIASEYSAIETSS
jgi:hypothetical protein